MRYGILRCQRVAAAAARGKYCAKARGFDRSKTIAAALRMSTSAFVDAARSTAASGSLVYEGQRAVHEYLQFHFGRPDEVLPYGGGPSEALGFPKRCADLCTEAVMGAASEASPSDGEQQQNADGGGEELQAGRSRKRPLRALDVGCSVGGIAFELTRSFDEVVGVDFSASFVEAAERMRVKGRTEYECLEQGSIVLRREAALPEGTIPSRARFFEGDACSLDVEKLGSFDAVLASNLLCRLPKPQSFLEDLPALVRPGGVAVLISPYSWLKEYTSPSQWLGGFREGGDGAKPEGEVVDSFDRIRALMEANGAFQLEKRIPMPFLIREHARKFQWGCSDGTVWRRM
ncbi:unnamed protein product [Pylaiella littoralis]